MKKIVIESVNAGNYSDLSELLENRCSVDGNTVHLEIDETNNEEYVSVFVNMSLLLLMNYVSHTRICKTEEQSNFVLSHFFNDSDYRYSLTIDLMTYFETNDVLRESSFFIFNLGGLKEDVLNLLEILKKQKSFEKDAERVRKNLTKMGKKLGDFKTLRLVEDDELGFALLAKNDVLLTPDNIGKEIGLGFEIDDTDEIMYICIFTALVCSILKTKKLIVTDSFVVLCEELVDALNSFNCDIEVQAEILE